ncbi:MAG: hypothetical protein IKI03_05435 [Clostridia bacterium]|nr:hypothetical protein [Clostridia bacterium]
MSYIGKGIYVEDNNRPFEFESAYYLDFHITSALVSICHLTSNNDSVFSEFENKYQYYHYYSDHLLFSLGQIANRFIITRNDSSKMKTMKIMNSKTFIFDSLTYPLLSNKKVRNAVEHIDEHNHNVIEEIGGVGGFNIIDKETNESIIEALKNNKKAHRYTLNLTTGELYVRYMQEEYTISFDGVKRELLTLRKSVKCVLETLKEPY